jgi:hypothetical protein
MEQEERKLAPLSVRQTLHAYGRALTAEASQVFGVLVTFVTVLWDNDQDHFGTMLYSI